MMKRTTWLMVGMIPLALLAACGPYKMHGRVVEGDVSYIAVVDKEDPRLKGVGLEGVLLRAQIQPGTLGAKTVSQETSDMAGNFSLPVDEWGAGLIDMESGVLARRRGFKSAEGTFRLPSSGRRVLIVLAPGQDPPGWMDERESVDETLRRFE
jgi:hypothetical protein